MATSFEMQFGKGLHFNNMMGADVLKPGIIDGFHIFREAGGLL